MLGVVITIGVVAVVAAVVGYLEGGKLIVQDKAVEAGLLAKITSGWKSLVTRLKGTPPSA